jgi:hypothetical protein
VNLRLRAEEAGNVIKEHVGVLSIGMLTPCLLISPKQFIKIHTNWQAKT